MRNFSVAKRNQRVGGPCETCAMYYHCVSCCNRLDQWRLKEGVEA